MAAVSAGLFEVAVQASHPRSRVQRREVSDELREISTNVDALNGNYQWFESLVGLDDHTGRRGEVAIEVLVDGKPQPLGDAKELTHRDGPRAIRVKVAANKELTLVVKFGRFGDVEDHVDWTDARLIK